MKILVILLLSLTALGTLSGCASPEEKAAEHLANGEALLAENRPLKARIEFKNALRLNQNLPAAWYGLARINEQRQEWDQAYNTLVRIRNNNPRYMDARVLLANIMLAANRIDEALEDARDIVELAPDDARAHAIMAAVQFRLNDLDAARQAVDQALQLDPQNEDAILVKARILIEEEKFTQALSLLDKMLSATPDNASYYAMKLGIYQRLDDQSAMLQTYTQMVQQFPDNIAFQQALIRHHIEADNLDQAQQLLKRRVEEYPDNIDEKLRLARFLYRHRSSAAASELLKLFIDQDSDEYRLKFALAEVYLRDDQTEQAIGIYDGIVRDDELNPNGLQARNVLARIYLLAGLLADSRVLIDEVLAQDKNNENALLVLARFNLTEGKQDDAITNLRTVLRDNPTSIEALTLLGQAQEEQGAANLAIETLNKAYKMNPASSVIADQLAALLLRNGQPEKADEILWESIDAGNESIETLKLLTQVKLRLGKWGQAEQLAQRLESIESEEALAQQVLGLAYHGGKQKDDSFLAFRRAHDLDPNAPQPIAALVKAYVEDGKPDKAKAFLLSVVAGNPENATAYHLLGQLSLREKDVQAAIGYFEKVVESAPESELGYLSLGSIYLQQRNFQQAEKIYSSGVKAVPTNLTLSINQALVVEAQGKLDRAILLYENLLKANPDALIARNNLASLLTDHRSDQASHERARVLAEVFRDSKIPLFRDTYAWASVRLGLYLEEAIAILNVVVRDNETVGIYHYHLGEAYRKNGNSFDARKHLRRAIELEDPESPVAIGAREALERVS
ncbi:tetratricopeptide repeat protein [Gammaproteobacteria bacterium]|nr:tetratricopeptide repeat protein [Gammaproteobacteria bacterium]